MKKILLGLFVMSTLSFACPNGDVHNAAEKMKEAKMFTVKGGKMNVNGFLLAIVFEQQYGSNWKDNRDAQNVVAGLQYYAASHKLEIVFE